MKGATVMNATSKRVTGIVVAVVVITLAVNAFYDGQVQSKRNAYRETVKQYESAVNTADNILRDSEATIINLGVLDEIETKQEEVVQSSQTLLELDDETYEGAITYNETVGGYTNQMSELNRIIGEANKTYAAIEYEKPQDLATPPTEKKVTEMLGFTHAPDLSASKKALAIAATLDERYKEQTELRETWNKRAKAINEQQRSINEMREKLYDMYGTHDPNKGTHVEEGKMLNES